MFTNTHPSQNTMYIRLYFPSSQSQLFTVGAFCSIVTVTQRLSKAETIPLPLSPIHPYPLYMIKMLYTTPDPLIELKLKPLNACMYLFVCVCERERACIIKGNTLSITVSRMFWVNSKARH